MEHVSLLPVDAGGDQCGEVAVAAVFAQQRRRVPEPGDRLVRYGERTQGGVQDPSSIGALIATRVARSAARASAGLSATSPRMRRSAVTLPSWRAASTSSGVAMSQTLGMQRATSPGAKL